MGTRRVSSLSPSWKRRLLLLRGAVPSTPAHNESMLGSAPPSPHPSTHVIHSHGFWQFASNRGKSFPFYTVTHFIRLKGGPYYTRYVTFIVYIVGRCQTNTHIATLVMTSFSSTIFTPTHCRFTLWRGSTPFLLCTIINGDFQWQRVIHHQISSVTQKFRVVHRNVWDDDS